jgi:hypothetical protein
MGIARAAREGSGHDSGGDDLGATHTDPRTGRALRGGNWGKTLFLAGCGSARFPYAPGSTSSARRPPIGAVLSVSRPP